MRRSAVIEGKHRYSLVREWDGRRGRVCWVMLNPSKADDEIDDMTVTKCVGFAKRWGYGSIEVVNLFTYRSTSPHQLNRLLGRGVDIIGPARQSHQAIDAAFRRADLIVVAWGGTVRKIDAQPPDIELWAENTGSASIVKCLGLTVTGEPRHPSRLAYDAELIDWPVPS